jgi:hypothetical protein
MNYVSKYAILLAAVAVLAAVIVPAAGAAQLTPFSYGFPSVYHNAEVTAFTKDILACEEFEDAFVSFSGGCGGCGVGGFGIGFPTIVQSSQRSMFASHTDFYHSEETDAFNCPWVGVGAVPFAGGYPGGWC